MALNDIYKASLVGAFGTGQQFVNTLHYRQVLVGLANPVEELAAQIEAIVLPELVQILPNPYIVFTVEIRQVTGSPLEGTDLPVNAQGVVTGDPLPSQVCPLVSWRTGLLGRANRGRMYLPAPVEGAQVAGQLSTTFMANVQTVADSMLSLSVLGDEAFIAVIYSADNNPTGLPITTAVVRQDLATQRRRRIGSGS